MKRLAPWRSFLAVLGCLTLAIVVLRLRDPAESIVPHMELSLFPSQIGGWKGVDLPLSSEEMVTLGPGEFLLRDYSQSSSPPVTLFLAYYQSQRSGDTIHSPKNCLPGSGWIPLKSGRMEIRGKDGFTVTAKRYIVGQGLDRMLVLYWYQAHGRSTPSEYWAKWFLATDAIRMNRTDGALIRVETPLEKSEQEAENQTTQFVREMLPLLNSYIPR